MDYVHIKICIRHPKLTKKFLNVRKDGKAIEHIPGQNFEIAFGNMESS
jgi:hypothetical protein